jgi:hypothetical protein
MLKLRAWQFAKWLEHQDEDSAIIQNVFANRWKNYLQPLIQMLSISHIHKTDFVTLGMG